jgi:hypothetical protein
MKNSSVNGRRCYRNILSPRANKTFQPTRYCRAPLNFSLYDISMRCNQMTVEERYRER